MQLSDAIDAGLVTLTPNARLIGWEKTNFGDVLAYVHPDCPEIEEQIVEEDGNSDPDDDDGYCTSCAGTGEGMWDGASCSVCRGRGFIRAKPDVDEPDDHDYFARWVA